MALALRRALELRNIVRYGILLCTAIERDLLVKKQKLAPLKILVIDENPIRAAILDEGLREAGQPDVTILDQTAGLVNKIYSLDPDVIIIDLENPSRDVLEQMFQVSKLVKRPIAMFVDQADGHSIEASVEAGVSAYIVDGLKKERVLPILELTMSRFNAFARLRTELEETKTELENRKLVDRAKGILMKTRQISENEAYELIRKSAMDQNKRIAQVAESIVTAADLLG